MNAFGSMMMEGKTEVIGIKTLAENPIDLTAGYLYNKNQSK